jgi:glycosyltransferase involved in cell wall biosynthesis
MRISLISLRAELGTTGERQSTLAIKRSLRELGADVDEIGPVEPAREKALAFRNVFDLSRVRRIARLSRDPTYDWHFVKIPTAAQFPLLDVVLPAEQPRLVVLLDSVCSGRGNAGRILRELRHEPIYALGKRIMNSPVWARFSRLQPKAIVCSAQGQMSEARRLLGSTRCSYWVIPNASIEPEFPAVWNRTAREPFIVGYIGHPYAYKGCLDVIEASRLLSSSPRCVFRAAFSFSGRPSVRREWEIAGGEDAQIVEVGEFLTSIDVLCVPLYTEFGTKVFPNVLLEAMRVGVPTITTRSPTAVGLFGEESPVAWLDKVSPETIAHAIRDLMTKDLQIVSSRLRQRYQEFDHRRTRQRWGEFLTFLAAEKEAQDDSPRS